MRFSADFAGAQSSQMTILSFLPASVMDLSGLFTMNASRTGLRSKCRRKMSLILFHMSGNNLSAKSARKLILTLLSQTERNTN